MAEKGNFYVDCDVLEKLVEKLHPKTTIGDLTDEEMEQVFVPPLKSPPDFETPGAILLAVKDNIPVFNYRDPNYKKINIGTFHRRNCPKKI